MTEERYRLFDTLIKTVTALIAVGVAGYGLLQYKEIANNNRSTQKLEQAKLAVEHSKLLFELNRQKSDILSRAAQAAADAAWSDNTVERLKAINQFTRLFVGEVSLVANEQVIDSGDRLNDSLDEIRGVLDPAYGRTLNPAILPGQPDPRKDKESYKRRLEEHVEGQTNAFVKACKAQIESHIWSRPI